MGEWGSIFENILMGWDGIGLEGVFSYLDVFKYLFEGKTSFCIAHWIQMYNFV